MVDVNYSQYNSPFSKPSNAPKEYQKETRDLDNAQDNWRTARDVGQVRLDHSRLNIFTSLSPGDTVDHFKFRVASPGPLRIGGWNDDTVRIELLDSRGRVIADSDESSKSENEIFKDLTDPDGRSDFQPGEYIIRVSRLEGDDAADEVPFSLQVQMGQQIEKDYDTTEYQAQSYKAVTGVTPDDPMASAQASPATLAAQAIGSMIDETSTHLTNILNGAYDLFPPVR